MARESDQPTKQIARRPKWRTRCLVASVVALLVVVGYIVPKGRFVKSVEPLRSAYIYWYNQQGNKYDIMLPDEVGNGRPAREIVLQDPSGLAEDRDGNIYVSDRGRYIWRIDAQKRAVIIAGTGLPGVPRDGAVAVDSHLGTPEGICVDVDGNLYIADSTNNLVVKVDPHGVIHHVAGCGHRGDSGDGGAALAAHLSAPFDVKLDSKGNLYIADFGNHRIRKVDSQGIITTVAGTGQAGFDVDGTAANETRLNGPYGIWIDPADRLVIADSKNHMIRVVNSDGTIVTVAGCGERGYSGDGGRATRARLDTPQSIFVDNSGIILIGDEHNHSVRRVTLDGIISTFIGNGTKGFDGDDGRRADARLNDPESVIGLRSGGILIADGDNGRVREISPEDAVSTLAGSLRPARGG